MVEAPFLASIFDLVFIVVLNDTSVSASLVNKFVKSSAC